MKYDKSDCAQSASVWTDSLKGAELTQQQPTDRMELAVRHTVSSIMSGRADVDRVVKRLADQGFQPDEVDAILTEAARRMNATGKAADHEFYGTLIKSGLAILAIAIFLMMIVGYPQHGRGVGVFYTAILLGVGALMYGAYGKVFKR